MKVSTVSIVMVILCTLSSCRSEGSGGSDEATTTVTPTTTVDSTTSAGKADGVTNASTGPQPNQVTTTPSAPTTAGSSSGSNDKNPESNKIETTTMSYSKWKEETKRRLDEKYEGIKREDQDRAINSLASSIQSALAKPGLSGAKQADLNFAYNLLMKAIANNDASVKKAAYDEALHILISVLSMLNAGSGSLS